MLGSVGTAGCRFIGWRHAILGPSSLLGTWCPEIYGSQAPWFSEQSGATHRKAAIAINTAPHPSADGVVDADASAGNPKINKSCAGRDLPDAPAVASSNSSGRCDDPVVATQPVRGRC